MIASLSWEIKDELNRSLGMHQMEIKAWSRDSHKSSDIRKNTFCFFISETPSSAPEIQGVPANFVPGDFLDLNCSVYNVRFL